MVKPRDPVRGIRAAGVGWGRAQGMSMSRAPVSTCPGKAIVDLTTSSLLRLKPFQHCSGVGGLGILAQEGTSEICGSQLSPASAAGLNRNAKATMANGARIELRAIFPSFRTVEWSADYLRRESLPDSLVFVQSDLPFFLPAVVWPSIERSLPPRWA